MNCLTFFDGRRCRIWFGDALSNANFLQHSVGTFTVIYLRVLLAFIGMKCCEQCNKMINYLVSLPR